MKDRTFIRIFLWILFGGMLFVAVTIVVVDPAFHFHAPVPGISYFLNKERYQNNGILRHFDYDALITGTSMAENCKTSEVDALFGTHSVKTCFMGATYREISDNIITALDNNPDLKLVFRAMDLSHLMEDADSHISNDPDTPYEFPTYLYDKNPLNDVHYLLNLKMLGYVAQDLRMTLAGEQGTTFNAYSSWDEGTVYSKETVLASFTRPEKSGIINVFTEEERETERGNLQRNILDLAEEHPDTEFYIWIPPYSICFFDVDYMSGNLERRMDALEYAMEMLTRVPNIHLFCFLDRDEIVTDLSLYKDMAHHRGSVNSMILTAMSSGDDRITVENYRDYMKSIREFYLQYDYDSIYQ